MMISRRRLNVEEEHNFREALKSNLQKYNTNSSLQSDVDICEVFEKLSKTQQKCILDRVSSEMDNFNYR